MDETMKIIDGVYKVELIRTARKTRAAELKKSGVKKKRRHFKSDRDKKFDIFATRTGHKKKAANRKANRVATKSRKINRSYKKEKNSERK